MLRKMFFYIAVVLYIIGASPPFSKSEFSDGLFIRSHTLAHHKRAKTCMRKTGPKTE